MSRAGSLREIASHGLGALLLDGEKLLQRVWPQPMPEHFEQLRMPFAAVAADWASGERAVFAAGALAPAVAASMAIPGIFWPVVHNGQRLVDGFVNDPVPTSSVADRCDLVVAVEVNGIAGDASFEAMAGDPLAQADRGIALAEHALTRARLTAHPADLLLRPSLCGIKPLDVLKAEAAIAAGEVAGEMLRRWLGDIGFQPPA
jgi:NTE family protein